MTKPAPPVESDEARIACFLQGIGIRLHFAPLGSDTFLPGVAIRDGALVVDRERLAWPGDLLHEAGHIAVTDPLLRPALHQVPSDAGEEMAAIAWSWAARCALELPPEVLFHAGGYLGGSQSLIRNFSERRYFGVPLLQCWDMTTEARPGKPAGPLDYPHMRRWLR